MRPARRAPAALAALAALSCPAAATAQDTWSTPFPGVRRLQRVAPGQVIHAAFVDLCAPGVSVRVTAMSERTRTVPSFGALVGAQLAVNGSFYNTANQAQTDGFVMHAGAAWGGTDHGYTGPVAFGDGRVELVPHEVVRGPEGWMREAVSGHPTLIVAGAARDNAGDTGLCPRNPRTAVGLTADRRTLILAVVDGRSAPSRVGMTCNELASLMANLGARDALNLDGGGSSTMWFAGAGVVNRPSDGSPRTVSNHLAVYARGSGAAPHCPTPPYRAQYVNQTFPLARTTLDLAPGETFTGYLEMRNTGSATWTPARTRLGTTQPRDRTSAVRGPDWLAPHRPAAVDRTVPPGMTGRFRFTLRAPATPGESSEYFNLLEEGVAWFSDPGQGGPADNVIQVRVRTVAPPPDAAPPDVARPDATARDAADDVAAQDAPEDARDAMAADDARGEDAAAEDVTLDDAALEDAVADAGADATDDVLDGAPDEALQGGCACRSSGATPAGRGPLAWGLALAWALRRRRRLR